MDARDAARAQELFDRQWRDNAARTDRMFAALMVLQWLGAIVASLMLSPRSWNGSESHVHPHVWLSVFLGGILTSLPVYLAWRLPGRALTRHIIALAQMMFSSLLIHVSGGRIETHFHVFGSLAFLAFYRDWKVLVPATLFVAVDHYLRGVFWPETVFGIAAPDRWRWIEHAGWVIFEDVFLAIACCNGVREMWLSANRTAELERINRDVQRQKLELETAYSAKNSIVEAALDAVVTMDSAGRIIGWNSQAESTFGFSVQEALGRPLAELIIPAKDREAHRLGLKRYLESGESLILNRRIEVAAVNRNGKEFPVELAVASIKSAGAVNFCAYARDITDRLQHANALRTAKEAAEEASQAKSAFLANMSHEIRTPLNAILGFGNLLLDDIDGDPEERRDYVQTIHNSGRHLLALIDDILDLSKIESGEVEIERVRCSPQEIIAASVSILRVRAEERGLSLEYFWKSETPETIQTDPSRLRQILMNLIGNAIKFTEVGSVQVSARVQPGDSPRLVIDVIDTGIGIDGQGMQRIFEPFVQADTSITRRFGGTGLGLSISRRLARLLGGDLTVTSELGRGSIFTVRIPTGPLDGVPTVDSSSADIVHSPLSSRKSGPVRLPPCCVLLVEDGATNRKLIALILERAGAKVRTAENGRVGVEVATAEAFDLILMDMQMPVMDGYRAVRELRRLGCTAPIIALTAHAMAEDEHKCRECGCSGYLTKPIDPHRLLATVTGALEHTGRELEGDRKQDDRDGQADTIGREPLVSTLPLDDPDFREIADEFVAALEDKLTALREACDSGDLKTVSEIAHWIKGSGGTAGFAEFTPPATALEAAACHRRPAAIPVQIKKLDNLFRRVRPSDWAAVAPLDDAAQSVRAKG